MEPGVTLIENDADNGAGTDTAQQPTLTDANKVADGIGGHLSTFASSAALYEIGFNHFFRGKDDGTRRRHLEKLWRNGMAVTRQEIERALMKSGLSRADTEGLGRDIFAAIKVRSLVRSPSVRAGFIHLCTTASHGHGAAAHE